MTRRTLLLLALLGSLSTSVWAQGNACTQTWTWFVSAGSGTGAEPAYFGDSVGTQYMQQFQAQYGGVGPSCSAIWEGVQGVWGGWSGGCHSVAWSCEPTPPPCPTCCPWCTGGKPINLANGNVYIQQTDVRIPGLGNGLTLARTWNSISPQVGIFGPNWVSTYEEQVSPGSDGTMKYVRGDGSVWSFAMYGDPLTYHLISPGNLQATLTEQGPGTAPDYTASWTVTFQNGEQRVFSVNPFYLILDPNNTSDVSFWTNVGRLVSIIDRNGNTTSLNYNTESIGCCQTSYTTLSSVTDPVGRHLNFTYGTGASSPYVTSVTSDSGSGISLTYSYAPSLLGGSVLTRVTQADNTFVTFTYDPFNNITKVNDTNGKLLESHTYDVSSHGLSSARANGVDALTVNYPASP